MPELTSTTVAMIGLGAMGLPIAVNLSTRGATVRGFDIATERMDAAAQAGVLRCGSALEAVAIADVVLLAVRDAAQLDTVLYGGSDTQDGIVTAMPAGSVVVLTSTVGIAEVRAVAARLADSGHGLVDAPVSGGPVRAGTGDLLVTVGADDDAWAAAESVLEAMSSTLVRVGSSAGDGQAMKTVNQLLCGVHIAAAGEALALAQALGLDPAAALDTLMAGAAQSFMLGDRGPRMLAAYDEQAAPVRSRLDIFVKDLGLVTEAARAVQLATPVAASAQQLFLLGQAQGRGAQDDSGVITVVAPTSRSRS